MKMERRILFLFCVSAVVLVAGYGSALSEDLVDYAVKIRSEGFQQATIMLGNEFLDEEALNDPEAASAMKTIYAWALNPEMKLTDYAKDKIRSAFPEEYGPFERLEGIYATVSDPEATLKQRVKEEMLEAMIPEQRELLNEAQRLRNALALTKGLEEGSTVEMGRSSRIESAEMSYDREADRAKIGYLFGMNADYAQIIRAESGCMVEKSMNLTRVRLNEGCEFEINGSVFNNLESGLLVFNGTILVRAELVTGDEVGGYWLGMDQYDIPAETEALWVAGPPPVLRFPQGLKMNDRITIARAKHGEPGPGTEITLLEDGDLELLDLPFMSTSIKGETEFEMDTRYGRMKVDGNDEDAGIIMKDQDNLVALPDTKLTILDEADQGFMVQTEDKDLSMGYCQDKPREAENFLSFCRKDGEFKHKASGSGFRLSMIEDVYRPQANEMIVISGINARRGINRDEQFCEMNGMMDCEGLAEARELIVPGASYLFNGMTVEQGEDYDRIEVEEGGSGRIWEEDGSMLDLGEDLNIPVEDEGLAIGDPTGNDFQGMLCTESQCYSQSGDRFGYCEGQEIIGLTGKASSTPQQRMMQELEEEWEQEEGCKDAVTVSKEGDEDAKKVLTVDGGKFDGARIELQWNLAFLYRKGSDQPEIIEWDKDKGRIYLPDGTYFTEDQFSEPPQSPEQLEKERERRDKNLESRYDELDLGILDKWKNNRYIEAIKENRCIVAEPLVLCRDDLKKQLEEKGIREGEHY